MSSQVRKEWLLLVVSNESLVPLKAGEFAMRLSRPLEELLPPLLRVGRANHTRQMSNRGRDSLSYLPEQLSRFTIQCICL